MRLEEQNKLNLNMEIERLMVFEEKEACEVHKHEVRNKGEK